MMFLAGYGEIKKVEILWADRPKAPKRNKKHMAGELFVKVTMHGVRGKKNIWSALLETCLPIMDMIDWTRSHPDNIRQCCSVYGIDAGRSIFLAVSFFCTVCGSLAASKVLVMVAGFGVCCG